MNQLEESEIFEVSQADTVVEIHATSNVHPIDGQTSAVEGEVRLSVADGEPDLSQLIEAEVTLHVDELSSGNSAYDTEMRRRLDARRYPRIIGRLTSVEPVSAPNRYRVVGDLTFHGVTRSVRADMEVVVEDGHRLAARWEQRIDIRDYGIKPPRILMFKVDPEVRIDVELVAKKKRKEQ